MRELVEYMAKELVDSPDEVRVQQVRGNQAVIFKLYVAQDDKGWVIGRKGRVANAMRALLQVAGTIQGRRRVVLDIV
ncbi:MAG: KH domain-containing protein [Chloroflexi bacterium]|nr:KH domain-containing protein [Chloroflexota bacterium]